MINLINLYKMSNECPSCKMKYKKNERIPYLLSCQDTICSKCISFNTEAYTKKTKGEFKGFKCPICCNEEVKSLNMEIKALYPPDDEPTEANLNAGPVQGEFEIIIKFLDRTRLAIKVNKDMKVRQLISNVAKQKGINENNLKLAFKKTLKEKDKTLEFYGVTGPVTLTQVDTLIGGLK